MRKFVSATCVIAALGFIGAARASSPGMVEGPPGCDWDATVISADAGAGVTLQLVKMNGTCMMDAGNCGKEGDRITAPLDGKDISAYAPGSTVHVWVSNPVQVNNDRQLIATLTHPECTRTPITP